MASTSSESTRRGRLPSRRRNVPEDTRDAGPVAAALPSAETVSPDRSSPSENAADSDESTSLPSTQRVPPERVGVRNRADGGSSWIPPSSIAPPLLLLLLPLAATAPAAAVGFAGGGGADPIEAGWSDGGVTGRAKRARRFPSFGFSPAPCNDARAAPDWAALYG